MLVSGRWEGKVRLTVRTVALLGPLVLARALIGQDSTSTIAPTSTDSGNNGDNSKFVQHVVDQFAGSEVWVTPRRHEVGLAKLAQNHCTGTTGFYLRFGQERVKSAISDFVLVEYMSMSTPFSGPKPMGVVADVTLTFAVADSMIRGTPFHPVTAASALDVRGYESRKAVERGDMEITQTFIYELPAGTLARLNGAKVRLQGPQRTCDGQLDERAQRALTALLKRGN